ncbi:MAG: hypothetical protein IKU54_04180 [Oscillospiraceae bacterium]|nr:hypothetical protein [Oscillospiraceae bacterium]
MNQKTYEQAYNQAIAMQKNINAVVATQYLGMPRADLKNILLTVIRKSTELKIFCHENGINYNEISSIHEI